MRTLVWSWEQSQILFSGAIHDTWNRNCAADAIQMLALRKNVQLRFRTSRARKELQVRIRKALARRLQWRCAERLIQLERLPANPELKLSAAENFASRSRTNKDRS